jgi:hypothetical protein
METVAIAAYISHLRSRTTVVPERVRSAWWRQAAGRLAFTSDVYGSVLPTADDGVTKGLEELFTAAAKDADANAAER